MNDVEAMKIFHLLGKIESSISEIRCQITQSINGNIQWQPTDPCSAHDQETSLRELVALSEEMGLYDMEDDDKEVQLEFDFTLYSPFDGVSDA